MTKKEVSPVYELIEKLCREKGSSPTKLCTEITGSRGNLPTWQKGNINPVSLVKIADYFNVSVDYLLGREESPVRVNGHVNGDNSVQNIADSPVTTIQEPPKQIIADGLTSEFMEAFQGLSFPDKMEVMNLTMQKMQKGA